MWDLATRAPMSSTALTCRPLPTGDMGPWWCLHYGPGHDLADSQLVARLLGDHLYERHRSPAASARRPAMATASRGDLNAEEPR